MPWTHRGSVHDTGFTWDLVDDLDSWRSIHDGFRSIEGCLMLLIHKGIFLMVLIRWGNDFDASDLLGNDFDLLGIFLPFLDLFLNFPLHFQPPGNYA